jgi:sulfonate transport system ATP-binding protein
MLTLQRAAKSFPNGYRAIDGISIEIGAGEIVGIVGASGCGKSTLLRLLSGLETPSAGAAIFNGRPLAGPTAEIGVVFQEPRLMPWLTVDANVAFGLRHLPRAERKARIAESLGRVGLAHRARALPRELSGGMAQRVALARAFATRPQILLLDEPFSALDAFTRMDLQTHLLDLWAYDKPTFVLVTHDIDEALVLADRILLMRGQPGRIHREFSVDLPRPRNRTSPRFLAYREEVLHELHVTAGAVHAATPVRRLQAV